MCGILAILGSNQSATDLRRRALELSSRLRHRGNLSKPKKSNIYSFPGPDWNGIVVQTYKTEGNRELVNVLAHERLAIVGVASGAQPIKNESNDIALTVNGEIYNHPKLRQLLKEPHTFRTGSDCECIVHLYEEIGDDLVNLLDGKFSFVISEVSANKR